MNDFNLEEAKKTNKAYDSFGRLVKILTFDWNTWMRDDDSDLRIVRIIVDNYNHREFLYVWKSDGTPEISHHTNCLYNKPPKPERTRE